MTARQMQFLKNFADYEVGDYQLVRKDNQPLAQNLVAEGYLSQKTIAKIEFYALTESGKEVIEKVAIL